MPFSCPAKVVPTPVCTVAPAGSYAAIVHLVPTPWPAYGTSWQPFTPVKHMGYYNPRPGAPIIVLHPVGGLVGMSGTDAGAHVGGNDVPNAGAPDIGHVAMPNAGVPKAGVYGVGTVGRAVPYGGPLPEKDPRHEA